MVLRNSLDVILARPVVGLTQTDVARPSGIERTSLSRLEWPYRELPCDKAVAIQRALELAGAQVDPEPVGAATASR